MTQFLRSQLDFVFFFYGLAFLALAVVCLGLRKPKAALPWGWLALFGLTHGVNEWLDMLSIDVGDSPWFAGVRLGMMILSFVCLAEFGRAGCLMVWGRGPGRWVFVPLMALAVLGSLVGMPGLNAASRYALGLTSGLGAALALWGASKTDQPGRRAMRTSAWAMALYALAAGAVVPKADFWPALYVNHDSFLSTVGVPVQLIRGLLACGIACGVWRCQESVRRADQPEARSDRSSAWGMVLTLLAVTAGGWFVTQLLSQRQSNEKKEQLLGLVRTCVPLVGGEQVKALAGDASDLGRPEYRQLKTQLTLWRERMQNVRFCYLTRMVGDAVVILVDSEPEDSKDYSPPGQVYTEASPEFRAALTMNSPVLEGPAQDRWGTWVTSLSPVRDPQTGQVLAFMGVDMDARLFVASVQAERLKGIGLAAMLSVATLLAFAARRRFRQALAETATASASTRRLPLMAAGVAVVVGTAVTILVFSEARHTALSTFEATFQQQASDRIEAIQRAMDHLLGDLRMANRFYETDESVSRDEFAVFTAPLATEHEAIQAIAWIPHIRDDQRMDCEAQARQEGVAGFQITEQDARGMLMRAGDREEYFPVYYVEPLNGNTAVMGFDSVSEPTRRAAMEAARDTGKPAVAVSVTAVQAPNEPCRLLVFIPAYSVGSPPQTVQERRTQLRGFTLGIYRMDRLVASVLSNQAPRGLPFKMEDPYASPERRLLYRHVPRMGADVDWDRMATNVQYTQQLAFADRYYQMTVAPNDAYVQLHSAGGYWWALPTGLLLTAMAASFLNVLLAGRLKAESLVYARTTQLRESELRYRAIFESSRDALLTLTPPLWTLTSANSATVSMFNAKGPACLRGLELWGISPEIQPDGRPSVQKAREMVEVAIREGSHLFEWTYRRLDGTCFPATVLLSKVSLEGRNFLQATVRDVTELKRVEESLKQERERLANIIKGTNVGTWEWNVQTGEAVFNERWAEIIGYTLEDLGPISIETWMKLAHPDDLKTSGELLERHFRGELDYYDCECRMKHKDGRWIWVHDRGCLVTRDANGKPLLMSGTHQDVTSRKQAELSLRESEKRFKDILYTSDDAILLIGNNTFVDCNQATAQMLGFRSRQDALMRHPSELSPPTQPDGRSSREKADEMIRLAVAKGFHRFEWMHRKANGEDFPVEVSLTPIVCEGKILLYCVWRDITARRRAENALRTEKANLGAIFESSPVGMLVLDETTRIVRINHAGANLVVGSDADLVHQRPGNAMGCVHGQEDPRGCGYAQACSLCPLRKGVESVISTGVPIRGAELAVELIRNGCPQMVWLSVGAEPLLLDERRHVVVSLSDITSRKQAEADLEAAIGLANEMAVRAESANHAKSEFLANMSHEIRTPLTAILGYSELLMDEGLPLSERLENTRVILRNGRHLLELINDVLDISKIEADKLVLEKRRCSVHAIVADVVSLMRVRAIEKRLALTVRYATPLPRTILTDEARLRQALINLVGNAIKFTATGEVNISVSLVHDQQNTPPNVRIDVHDTGIGMSAETISHLFHPFVQGDSSTTRKYGGTGLGLTITKRIIENMGGRVQVQGTPGQGSTFSVIVPTGSLEGIDIVERAAEAMDEAAETPSQPERVFPLQGLRILLAEDGPDNQRLIRTVLSRAGAEVDVVENGQLAIQAATSRPFDLVLMDMQMPEMDGYEATGRLRAAGYETPVIALTAHALSSDRARCIDAGCTEYLTKPIDRAAMVDLILKHTSRQQSVAAQAVAVPATSVAPELVVAQEPSPPAVDAIASQFADDKDLAEVIESFVQQLPQRCRAMREALSNNDLPTLHRLAHQMKGAGGSYGYPILTQVSMELESAAKAGDQEACGLHLHTLAVLSQAVTRGLKTKEISRETS